MALAGPEVRTLELTDEHTDLDQPYHVFLWNDPVTPMPVVVLILKRIFHYGEEKAAKLMLTAHERGKVVVWTGARDRAVDYSIQLGTAGLHSTVAKDS
ncbi:MAG: ATP-dependent Clp protease adaptor ClpS [Acidimicrobiales bacterium]